MSTTEFDTDLGLDRALDDVTFDTDLDASLGIAPEILASAVNVPVAPTNTVTGPSVNTAPKLNEQFTLSTGQPAWKAQGAINTQKVDKGIHQKQEVAGAMEQSGKDAVAQLRQQAEDMTRKMSADGGPSADASGPSGPGKFAANAAIDTAAVASIATVSPEAAAAVAAVSVARDVGNIAKAAIVGQGSAATMGKGNDLARSSSEMSRSGGQDTGYIASDSSPSAADAPVTNQVFSRLSHGPGFGRMPSSVTEADVDYAHDTLPHIALAIENSPEMQTALNTLQAGSETAQATYKVTNEGVVATVDNMLDAAEISSDISNPFEIDMEKRIFV